MAKVTVYTKSNCPYCTKLKLLLKAKGVAYEEIDAESRDELRGWLVEATGQMTLPQLFVGERSLGGFTDVEALDRKGELDALIGRAGPA